MPRKKNILHITSTSVNLKLLHFNTWANNRAYVQFHNQDHADSTRLLSAWFFEQYHLPTVSPSKLSSLPNCSNFQNAQRFKFLLECSWSWQWKSNQSVTPGDQLMPGICYMIPLWTSNTISYANHTCFCNVKNKTFTVKKMLHRDS